MFLKKEVKEFLLSLMGKSGGEVFVVGGSVRDYLRFQLGQVKEFVPKDVDVEVYGVSAEKLFEALREIPGVRKVDALGKSFGVFKVQLVGGEEVDVALPRRESKVGKGHRGFMVTAEPGLHPREAARRRDFTWNALMFNVKSGEVLDFFAGVEDLRSRRVRAVDERTFGDDPLRILRGAQFAARFGFSVEQRTMEIFRAHAREVRELAGERIFEEFRKLFLKAGRPSVGLRVLKEAGALAELIPEVDILDRVEQDPLWHPEGNVWEHTLMVVDEAARVLQGKEFPEKQKLAVMWAALLHDVGKTVTTRRKEGRVVSPGHAEVGGKMALEVVRRFTGDKEILRAVKALVEAHMRAVDLLAIKNEKIQRRAARRLFAKLSQEGVTPGMMAALWSADLNGRGRREEEKAERLWKLTEEEKQIKPLIMGRHLLKIGVKPGPQMGQLLRRLYQMQLDGEFATVEEGLKIAEKLLAKA